MNMMPDQALLSPDDAATLNPTDFFGTIIANLAETLEDTVGLADASGFISTVGENIGDSLSQLYDTGAPVSDDYIGQILVDLKRQIGGDFSVMRVSADEIVLTNTRCPFADRVHGKPSLCMMTTNVFGRIVADRTGYAHVNVEESIAQNKAACRVVVTLKPDAARPDAGIEFYN